MFYVRRDGLELARAIANRRAGRYEVIVSSLERQRAKHAGSRVFAIRDANDKSIFIYGFGCYEGDHVPPPGIKMWGLDLFEHNFPNPKITLDNGKVVWGCECWWGPEEKFQQVAGNRRVEEVDIEADRERHRDKPVNND